MLKQILEAARLDADYCARLLGVSLTEFTEWIAGSRPLPSFVLSELSAILDYPSGKLIDASKRSGPSVSDLAPAVWFKLRGPRLSQEDRDFVALLRKLGFFMDQLQTIRQDTSRQFVTVFETIRKQVDASAPPVLQGYQAAEVFRQLTGLAKCQTGIGEDIRRSVRNLGVILIESPLPQSQLEGCSMRVGREGASVPCIFANTYRSTWFRRNVVLMHEIGHAIFDLGAAPVSIDYLDGGEGDDFTEVRAQGFARGALVPLSVLRNESSRWGTRWHDLSPSMIAQLMASTHAEQKTILEAACEYGLFPPEKLEEYQGLNCAGHLAELSEHALSTEEFLRRQPSIPPWISQNRKTALGGKSLRLPAGYVDQVIKAFNDGMISRSKVCEMLLMDKDTMEARFGSLLVSAE